jgi:hypothetical protein
MVSGAGVSACLGGGASIVGSDFDGCESVPVDLEHVVDGAHEPPFARRGIEASPSSTAMPEAANSVGTGGEYS